MVSVLGYCLYRAVKRTGLSKFLQLILLQLTLLFDSLLLPFYVEPDRFIVHVHPFRYSNMVYDKGIHLELTLCLLCRQQAKPGCLIFGKFDFTN